MAVASAGVPAHATLLYPFVEPRRLDVAVRERIARVCARHSAVDLTLEGPHIWPGALYAAFDPAAPLVALHAALQREFPEFPIYGGRMTDFVPHVTVAEGAATGSSLWEQPPWSTLPMPIHVSRVSVIASADDGHWRTVFRIPLSRPAARPA